MTTSSPSGSSTTTYSPSGLGTATSSPNGSTESSGLSNATIEGVAIGLVVITVIATVVGFIIKRTKKNRGEKIPETNAVVDLNSGNSVGNNKPELPAENLTLSTVQGPAMLDGRTAGITFVYEKGPQQSRPTELAA